MHGVTGSCGETGTRRESPGLASGGKVLATFIIDEFFLFTCFFKPWCGENKTHE